MLQRLIVALAQVKAGDTSEKLLNEILAFTLHRKKEKSHIRTINLKYQPQQGMKI